MKLHLIRSPSTPAGTPGKLLFPSGAVLLTLEPPWANNQKLISSIPPGLYKCRRRKSPRFGWTYRVENVPGRAGIVFHSGNTLKDTHGCILLGVQREIGGTTLIGSKLARENFMRRLEGVFMFELLVSAPG